MPSSLYAPTPRQGVPPERTSDVGPIPADMLDDLRAMLWKMETASKYWAIAMGLIIAIVWLVGVGLFTLFDTRRGPPDKMLSLAVIALTLLAALAHAPFSKRCSTEAWEARELREVLYTARLENLAYHMAVLRMAGDDELADRLTAIWCRHGLEPGWMARRRDSRPQFR